MSRRGTPAGGACFDRRELLAAGAGLAAAGWLPAASRAQSGPAQAPVRSTVAEAASPAWLSATEQGPVVQPAVVAALLHAALKLLTGKPEADQAMRCIVSPRDRVALKFNRLSRDFSAANRALLAALTELLQSAGVDKGRILVLEAVNCDSTGYATPDLTPVKAYKVAAAGPDGKPAVLETRLTRCVETQVDCIFSLADLKNHNVAGITGALKNVSHAGGTFMTDPQSFHAAACDPAVAAINCLGPLRTKTRLGLINGLKGLFEGGPVPTSPGFQWRHDALLAATDRVALDRVAWEIINEARRARRLRPIARVPTLATAAAMGLGTDDLKAIHRARVHLPA